LTRIVAGEQLGTRIEPTTTHLESRKRWLLTDRVQGKVYIDDGAARVLRESGASLLPVGIRNIEGQFSRGATLAVVSPQQETIAHGLTNYSSAELAQISGKRSPEINTILGYSYGDHVIHRNNMVLLE
jgi:glutamate 5-kinase